MKINNIDLFQLLPQFMRDDRNSQAFVYAIQSQLNAVSSNIEYAKIYSRVDSMGHELLDELAWQFNVPEYDYSYGVDIKRKVIKSSIVTHYQRGTVRAVEKVVENIYGNATLEEWFEYDGEPFHFRVYTSNPNSSDEMLADLERIVKETQNVRSYLEQVVVELMENMSLHIGCKAVIMSGVELKTTDIN